ncbi:MAG TPA: HAMP domain-containing sensor histidine kinase [Stellaceae bacterium]|nr:HAMP domain-containing sensor histidine kinase [Stellaceae bacterium]
MLLDKTLRSSTLKLAAIYIAVVCAAILLLFAYVYETSISFARTAVERDIAAEQAWLAAGYARGGAPLLARRIAHRSDGAGSGEWSYLLVDRSLAPLAGNLRAWPNALSGTGGWSDLPLPSGARIRAVYQILPDGDRLLVGRSLGDLEHFDRSIAFALGWAVGLLALLAVAAGVSTSRRSVSRIEAINTASREIMRTGLGKRIPLRGTGDEWDELAGNLNAMLARIEELVEANRQVSDNLAHDLRTPLTRVRGRLEKAYHCPPAIAEYPAVIGQAIAELDGVLKTFSSLLRISRIEVQDRGEGFRAVDLSALAREVVELFEPAAEEAGVRLHAAGADGIRAVGDRDLLFDALSNLVDNAIHHGGPDGEVTVAVAEERTGPAVTVADTGPGIPAEERRNVLKRFYRLERSRNSPGNGLGLSLVAAVAGLHGARIEMSDNAPGLKATLRLPPSAPASGEAQPSLAAGKLRPRPVA